MLKRLSMAVALLAAIVLTVPGRVIPAARADEAASGASAFSPAQRAEIVQIMREAMKKDPTILRDAVEAMQADEQNRQQAAAKAAIAARKSDLVSASDPVAGNPSGDVTVIEFFDVRCPYCKRLDPELAALLTKDHGVRLVYKDLPILGEPSRLAAKALLAAQAQGHYEDLRAALMKEGGAPTAEGIDADAKRLGLDVARLDQDMQAPAIQSRIDANLKLAHDLGISGTPAMVIGNALIPGAVTMADLQSAIASARRTD